MFERYTEEARNAVWFAKEEAIALDTSQVETEHLLVGILRADPVLRASVQIDTTRVCLNGGSASKFQPLSHESKRILAYAAEEAERSHYAAITCRHLALGILREKDCKAAKLLRDQGITREILKEGLIL